MENKHKEIILNCEKMERRFALLSGGRIEEYKIERDDNTPQVGDIYLGKIINLDISLQAAFVDIGAAKNAFLHFREMIPGNSELIEQFQMEQMERLSSGKKSSKKTRAAVLKHRWNSSGANHASLRKISPIYSSPEWKFWFRW